VNDLEWMDLHLHCLYHHDARDRILSTRQPGGWLCPVFHMGRTQLGNVWRFREDLPRETIAELSRLAGKEGPLPQGHPAPERVQAIRSVIGAATEILSEWRGPAFRFPEEIASEPAAPGEPEIAALEPGMEGLLDEFFGDMKPELVTRQPIFAAIEDGRAVSLAHAARPRAVDGSPMCLATEVGVETAPGHRGRGLAPRVVAAWGREVREAGGEPMYSTSWDNKASRGVARKLGLLFYGEDWSFS
jgi:hypothetical protein